MQSITFVLAVAVLHTVTAHVYTKHSDLMSGEYFDECMEELHVPENVNADDIPDTMKCVVRCQGSKNGILRDNGDIDEQPVVEFLEVQGFRSREIKEILTNCKVLLKDTSCGAFYDFVECILKDVK